MKRIIGALTAALLSLSFGMAFADEKAMKEHQEMGTQGVSPHMTKEKEKELAKKHREEAMKQHQEMGTKGVTPHELKKKRKQAAQAGQNEDNPAETKN